MISFSVGSSHPDKYSYEIFYQNLLGWGNLSEKIISIKRNDVICFFSNGDFPSRICYDIFKTALFSQKLLLHISSE